MKQAIQTILTLSLIIVFLLLCGLVTTAGYAGLWLHTYNVFTQKTKVADVDLSEIKSDSAGEYIEVTLTQYSYTSGLENLFGISNSKTTTTEFKIYGDSIYIGGPIVKFKDELTLLNFKTIYKLSKIYGRYSDNTKEINRSDESQSKSSYDLNGGYGDWKVLFENYRSETLLGQIYRIFVDTTQLSEPGQFASNRTLKYELYMGNSGFLWELKTN